MVVEECEIGILFADVAGSTRLYELLGDIKAHAAIRGALGSISEVVRKHSGKVVKAVGDEVMAAFPRPAAMVEAAIEMQRRAFNQAIDPELPPGYRIKLRIGIHFGPGILLNGDYHGNMVNIAARMVAVAKGDEIIAPFDLARALPGHLQSCFRPLDTVRFRGASSETAIVEIVWQGHSNLTQIPASLTPRSAKRPSERLSLATPEGESWVFDVRSPPFLIGREEENTLCIRDSRISRRHATIERQLSNWVFVDHSSNGSFIETIDRRIISLRRETYVLAGEGKIGLGSTEPGHLPGMISFRVEQERA